MVVRVKLILIVSLLSFWFGNAQVTNEGTPASWKMQTAKKKVKAISMKSFDLNSIKAEDEINDKNRAIPYRFGHEFGVNLGLNNAGVWDELDNGDRIWRINIVSKGAKTLNFIFNTYDVPKGATLYVYNDDRSDLLGAYTSTFNRKDKVLGTWLIDGESVWIEYFEPFSVNGQGELNISKVIHGYRSISDAMVRQKSLGSSADCNHDVDCSVGNDFDCIKDKLKRSVALFILGGGVCSGTLINNTNNDRAPYFLSANHCFVNNLENTQSDPATWAFRFNWISPNPSCGTTESSSQGNRDQQTTSGATILSRNEKSDVLLINIDTDLPRSWDLEWAGWDRTGSLPDFVVGIHHPAGDIMKICRENDPLNKILLDFNRERETETWEIEDWDIGVTEGGSSGSAIFDQHGRIIGQLAGGAAACNGIVDNDLSDYYGRFDVSWEFGDGLANWLDPARTNTVQLNMLSQELEGMTITDVNNFECPSDRESEVFFEPTKAVISVSSAPGQVLEYEIYDISGKLVGSGKISSEEDKINMADKSSGMYFIYIENVNSGASFTKKVIINQRF